MAITSNGTGFVKRTYTDPVTQQKTQQVLRQQSPNYVIPTGVQTDENGKQYTEEEHNPQMGMAAARGVVAPALAQSALGATAGLANGNPAMGAAMGAGTAVQAAGNLAANALESYMPNSKVAATGAGALSTAGSMFGDTLQQQMLRTGNIGQGFASAAGAGLEGLFSGALNAVPGGTTLAKGIPSLLGGLANLATGGGVEGFLGGVGNAAMNVMSSPTLGKDFGSLFRRSNASDYAHGTWGQNLQNADQNLSKEQLEAKKKQEAAAALQAQQQKAGQPAAEGQPAVAGQPAAEGQPAVAGQPAAEGQPAAAGQPAAEGQPASPTEFSPQAMQHLTAETRQNYSSNPQTLFDQTEGKDLSKMPSDELAAIAHSHYMNGARAEGVIPAAQKDKHAVELRRIERELQRRKDEGLLTDATYHATNMAHKVQNERIQGDGQDQLPTDQALYDQGFAKDRGKLYSEDSRISPNVPAINLPQQIGDIVPTRNETPLQYNERVFRTSTDPLERKEAMSKIAIPTLAKIRTTLDDNDKFLDVWTSLSPMQRRVGLARLEPEERLRAYEHLRMGEASDAGFALDDDEEKKARLIAAHLNSSDEERESYPAGHLGIEEHQFLDNDGNLVDFPEDEANQKNDRVYARAAHIGNQTGMMREETQDMLNPDKQDDPEEKIFALKHQMLYGKDEHVRTRAFFSMSPEERTLFLDSLTDSQRERMKRDLDSSTISHLPFSHQDIINSLSRDIPLDERQTALLNGERYDDIEGMTPEERDEVLHHADALRLGSLDIYRNSPLRTNRVFPTKEQLTEQDMATALHSSLSRIGSQPSDVHETPLDERKKNVLKMSPLNARNHLLQREYPRIDDTALANPEQEEMARQLAIDKIDETSPTFKNLSPEEQAVVRHRYQEIQQRANLFSLNEHENKHRLESARSVVTPDNIQYMSNRLKSLPKAARAGEFRLMSPEMQDRIKAHFTEEPYHESDFIGNMTGNPEDDDAANANRSAGDNTRVSSVHTLPVHPPLDDVRRTALGEDADKQYDELKFMHEIELPDELRDSDFYQSLPTTLSKETLDQISQTPYGKRIDQFYNKALTYPGNSSVKGRMVIEEMRNEAKKKALALHMYHRGKRLQEDLFPDSEENLRLALIPDNSPQSLQEEDPLDIPEHLRDSPGLAQDFPQDKSKSHEELLAELRNPLQFSAEDLKDPEKLRQLREQTQRFRNAEFAGLSTKTRQQLVQERKDEITNDTGAPNINAEDLMPSEFYHARRDEFSHLGEDISPEKREEIAQMPQATNIENPEEESVYTSPTNDKYVRVPHGFLKIQDKSGKGPHQDLRGIYRTYESLTKVGTPEAMAEAKKIYDMLPKSVRGFSMKLTPEEKQRNVSNAYQELNRSLRSVKNRGELDALVNNYDRMLRERNERIGRPANVILPEEEASHKAFVAALQAKHNILNNPSYVEPIHQDKTLLDHLKSLLVRYTVGDPGFTGDEVTD